MDDDQFSEVHLIKLKFTNKNVNRINVTCPYLERFSPTVQLKSKSLLYVPLVNKLLVSKDLISNQKWQEIPLNTQPLLEYPFDRHNIKIQTYDDQEKTAKGQVVNMQLQFSLFLTIKEINKNFVSIYFKHANFKKDPNFFRKMSPQIIISTQESKIKTRQIKDGHMNPRFEQEVQIPFKSVFDKIFIEIKDKENSIGHQNLYIFELFGKNDERELELKSQRKIVGSLFYWVNEFEPQDF